MSDSFFRAIKAEHQLETERAARSLILEELGRITNLQTPPASPFATDPVQLLEQFEKIESGPWRDHLWSEHKLWLQVAMRERDWRKIKAAEQKIQDTQMADIGLYSSELEKIKDPAQKSAFLREHRDAIEAEVRAVQHEATRLHNNSVMAEPATL